MKIKEITSYLESYAPLQLQESYDNAGLIIGNPNKEINSVLIALDCTESIIEEAIAKKCELVICHHPIIFEGLKKITGKNYVERIVINAIKNDIAIYAIHTNLDNIINGVNGKIAEVLNLKNVKILAPAKNTLRKLITFCPVDHAEALRKALFNAGAGNIGNYDQCSFNAEGTGTFRANKNAKPFVGEIDQLHLEKEVKIETIFPAHLENKLINALLHAHPYEEVAYDIINLNNKNNLIGAGIIGELAVEEDTLTFLKRLKTTLNLPTLRHTSILKEKVKKIAICGGSGFFLTHTAIARGADVFITADIKYHQFYDADNQILIADAGHYETEQFIKQLLYDILTEKFSNFAFNFSEVNTNPINYL